MRVQVLLLVLGTLALALPAQGGASTGARGSLRGALRALERRRRAPPGPVYPLASFQYPDRAAEYLASREYQENTPIYLDPNERDEAIRKALLLGYLEKDEDYPSEDLTNNYKPTAFRERSGQLKGHHKIIAEKKRSSPFRERGGKHSYQSDRLRELFFNELAEDEENQKEEAQLESDAEYVELLKELWDKYKYTHAENPLTETPEDVIRIYNKDRNLRKRQIPGEFSPNNWGPIAFKKKRNSNQRVDDADTPNDFLYSLKFISQVDPSAVENLKDERVSDEDDDSDVSKVLFNREQESRYSPFEAIPPNPSDAREEYMLSLQPLNSPQSTDDIPDEVSSFDYENAKEKRFPVSKRSGFSKPIFLNHQVLEKRNLLGDKKNLFRSSGTDPRVIKELTNIFGDKDSFDEKTDLVKKPVKRSSIADDTSHEVKPPTVGVLSHHHGNESHENHTHDHEHDHDHDHSEHDHDHDHEHKQVDDHDALHSRHEHENKPPLLQGSEEVIDHSHEHEDNKDLKFQDEEKSHLNIDHPIILKKKSIDWSNYFGYDKRKKKSVSANNMDLNYLRNLYLRNAKKHLNDQSYNNLQLLEEPLEEAINIDEKSENSYEAKRKPKQIDQIKLDVMDNKLKTMESAIVDEALQYSGTNDGLDTKEEQEIKEKILSRLAAAYSLEKMRKALKEFKTSLQAQRNAMKDKPAIEYDEDKEKRTSSEHERKKNPSNSNNEETSKLAEENNALHDKDIDFESEQGAGHFLNGPIEPLSEGYMGGSGMKIKPPHNDGIESGQCPVLDRIVRRCHSVDILAGDHGQLFLPLCSLHQICYLCGPSSPTGCDLIFVSEADSVCGRRAACQQAARAALMALREDHGSLADDLEGECGPESCLYRAIETHSGWQHPFKR